MVVLAVVVVMVRVVGRVVVLVVMVVVSMYTITEEDVSVDGEKVESLFQKCAVEKIQIAARRVLFLHKSV